MVTWQEDCHRCHKGLVKESLWNTFDQTVKAMKLSDPDDIEGFKKVFWEARGFETPLPRFSNCSTCGGQGSFEVSLSAGEMIEEIATVEQRELLERWEEEARQLAHDVLDRLEDGGEDVVVGCLEDFERHFGSPPRHFSCHNTLPVIPTGDRIGGDDLDDERSEVPTEGRKDDDGKARYDLIPSEALHALAELYGTGARKYGERNWEKGIVFGRLFAALERHAWAWWRGEMFDQEDGQHHLISVAWCAFALYELERTHPDLDDRPERGTKDTATAMAVLAALGKAPRKITPDTFKTDS